MAPARGARRRPRSPARSARAVEAAGATEPFRDAVLYDWEYRRRRDDVAFYRMLAGERGGPVLDLGCGTGRLLIPLARDGFDVVGVDLSVPMLGRARAKIRREGRRLRGRTLLVHGDLRALPLRGPFPLAVMAFHTIQHLVEDHELVEALRGIRRVLGPDGWLAFDVFAPRPRWLARAPHRRFDATVFRHPGTKQRLEYSVSHHLDERRRALHVRFHYRRVSPDGQVARRGSVVHLCHRQLTPIEVEALLARAGLRLVGRWGGFNDEPLDDGTTSEQHVYLARPAPSALAGGAVPSRGPTPK